MRLGKRLYSLVMFLVVSVLGGILVAGLAVPAAGLTAELGKAGAAAMDTLPAELETPPQAERSRVLLADGSLLANFYDENRQYVTLDQIAPIMRAAQVAIEDHRFYEHGALDIQGTLRALVSTARGVTQGASTLTQQYVKMVQVSTAAARGDEAGVMKATENTVARKIQELRYAIAIEKQFTKDQILERYLNIAYYGDGAYGVEAAAMHYFGVHADKLTLPQAAMLAGLVRNPVTTDPVHYPRVAIERRNDVLDRMAELGLVSPDDKVAAQAVSFDKTKVKRAIHGCFTSRYPFICDYVERTLLQSPSLGSDKATRKNTLYRGGLTIQTEIDPKAQDRAQKAISNFISPRDPVDSVIILLEPKTRLIVAMAQNRFQMGAKAGQTYWNMAVSNAMGGTDGYQGGSTFKGFVTAAALKNGYGGNVSFNIKRAMQFKGQVFRSCDGPTEVLSPWTVDSDAAGRIDLYRGAALSVNGYFVRLEQQGNNLCDATKIAKSIGLQPSMGTRDLVKYYSHIPSFTLGIVEVSPISMVNAYATFANRGVRCDPIILKSIVTPDGKSLAVPDANCKQVIDPEIADGVNKIMQGPMEYGTARNAKVPGYQMAGKTGTVSSNKAVWLVGYTPELAGAAMISYSKDKRYAKYWAARGKRFLSHITLPVSHHYISGFGADAGVHIFRPAFAAAIKNYPHSSFTEPPSSVMDGRKVPVPSCSSLATCRTTLRAAGFDTMVNSVNSNTPPGTFLGLSPSGVAVMGSTITIVISKGPRPAPTPTPTPTPSTPPSPPGKGGKKK